MMQTWDDLKYSFRLLCKTPVFSALMLIVVVASLSLYLASYTMGTQISHEPMPFPNGDNYVKMRIAEPETGFGVGYPDFDTYLFNRFKESSANYLNLGIYQENTYVISDGEYPQTFPAIAITASIMQGLDTNPVLGRGFTAEDSIEGSERVVLLSHPLWQDYYNGDLEVIGRASLIDGVPHTVIGVMPEGFGFPRSNTFWIPMTDNNAILPGEGGAVVLIGVLKEGISYTEAETELTEILRREANTYPESYGNREVKVYDYSDTYAGPGFSFRLPLYLNFVTLLLLIIAAVNLSSLLLIRYGSRKHELLVRSSLGASSWQLVKQMLLESFVICFAGLLLSFLVSEYLLRLLAFSLLERGLIANYWFDFSMDTGGLLTGAVSVLIVWIGSGTLVSIRAFKSDPGEVTTTANKGSDDKKFKLTTRLIVGFELILTCFLLVCCGAMIKLLLELSSVDHGVDPENLSVASVSLTHTDYDSAQSRLNYLEQFKLSASEIPGVDDIGATTAIPQRPGVLGRYSVGGLSDSPLEERPTLTTVWIDGSYLRTAGVDLLEGRAFDIDDAPDADRVAIISEQFADQLWPGETAIGKQIDVTSGDDTTSLRVVGVISHLLQAQTSALSLPTVYRPLTQDTTRGFTFFLRVQSQVDMADLETALRDIAVQINRNVPLFSVRTLNDQIYLLNQGTDLINFIFVIFASVTLILASIGIYTVMARAIQLSTREIGVRRALGSTDYKVAWRYVKHGINFLIASFVIGGIPACLLIVMLAPTIGFPDLDFVPVVGLTVALLMSIVVLIATYVPAIRATQKEPGDALRYE